MRGLQAAGRQEGLRRLKCKHRGELDPGTKAGGRETSANAFITGLCILDSLSAIVCWEPLSVNSVWYLV